jgi:hypothetical protein
MTNQERVTEVLFQMDFENHFRIFFKNFERAPQFGMFVKSDDHDELMEKGFVRFLSESKVAAYQEKVAALNIFTAVGFTRIIKLEELKSISKQS